METTRRPMRTLRESLEFIKVQGWSPGTVIDIGAAWGTPELLEAFPSSYHILVDPAPCYELRFQALLDKYNGEYHMVAIDDSGTSLFLNIPSKGNEVSSQLQASKLENCIEVPVQRLDSLLGSKALLAPLLIKTDCQGYDMNCIRSAGDLLDLVDIVVCEVNLFHPTGRPDLPDFGDSVIAMRTLGFSVYDIVSYQTRPLDGALGYVDVVFAKDTSQFRARHQWA